MPEHDQNYARWNKTRPLLYRIHLQFPLEAVGQLTASKSLGQLWIVFLRIKVNTYVLREIIFTSGLQIWLFRMCQEHALLLRQNTLACSALVTFYLLMLYLQGLGD